MLPINTNIITLPDTAQLNPSVYSKPCIITLRYGSVHDDLFKLRDTRSSQGNKIVHQDD